MSSFSGKIVVVHLSPRAPDKYYWSCSVGVVVTIALAVILIRYDCSGKSALYQTLGREIVAH